MTHKCRNKEVSNGAVWEKKIPRAVFTMFTSHFTEVAASEAKQKTLNYYYFLFIFCFKVIICLTLYFKKQTTKNSVKFIIIP